DFSRAQVLAVSRHVASPLDHLPGELIAGQPSCDSIESGPPQSAAAADAMTIPALLVLQHQRPLSLERRSSFDKFDWRCLSVPCRHLCRPRRKRAKIVQCPKSQKNDKNREYRHWPAASALFTSARYEGEQKEKPDRDHRHG